MSTLSKRVLYAAFLTLSVQCAGTSVLAGNIDAEALANRFSPEAQAAADAELARAVAERRKAEETDMLARARAEAAALEEELRKIEEAAQEKERLAREAEATAKAEAERVVREAQEAEQKRVAEAERAVREAKEAEAKEAAEREARRIAEAEKVAKGAQDAAAKQAAEAEATRAAEAEALKTAEAEKVAAEKAKTEQDAQAKRAADLEALTKANDERLAAEEAKAKLAAEAEQTEAAQRAVLAEQREEEASRLSEKLKRVREQRSPSEMALGAAPAEGQVTEAPEPAAEASARAAPPKQAAVKPAVGNEVAVLLVMKPGTYGIRRGSKAADPVLCAGNACYVSSGSGRPAKRMTRRAALGPFNTFGGRAGACRGSLSCVFRSVDLSGAQMLQPVDLHVLKHDRREARPVLPDGTCEVQRGRLDCAKAVTGNGWIAWIVPEAVAREAGTDGLEAALSGLAAPVRNASIGGGKEQ